ncbi:GMC oxidoreductase [Xylariaceae sp. AK1471]|nr:GMC oxidoreductase [Xylariaceae sp. AK1471]
MGLYTTLPNHLQEVDVIIAGGGTAACIIAARLSDADPDLSILVVECGPSNIGEPALIHLAFWISQILPTSKFTLFYKAIPSDVLANRSPVIPSGGTLGGGSSINLMQYSRGQRSDYDDPRSLHGHDGPIHVSEGTFRSDRFSTDFINALDNVAGWSETEDVNTMDTINHAMRAMRYFLHPRLEDGKHSNLHAVAESFIERVLFDDHKKANGVVFKPNPAFRSESQSRTVKARKLVVLSCGALGSPLVLERSGVGNPEIVKRGGADLVADLPGVGENYDDHHLMIYAYKSSLNPDETLDGVIAGRSKPEDMIKQGDRFLGWNAIDVQAKVRPSDAEVVALGPKFQDAWDKEFKPHPQKPLMLMASTACFPGDPTGQPPGQYFSMASFSAYPFSRGHIHITGPGLDDTPEFDVGFFNDSEGVDTKNHLWMYKKQREITRRIKVFRGEVASWHPRFPAGSKAVCIDTDGPLQDGGPEIEYSAEDDEAILQWLREHVDTTWHSMGTCKMAPREKNGVVDPSLNVYSVQGLKVADMSIPPGNVGPTRVTPPWLLERKPRTSSLRSLG